MRKVACCGHGVHAHAAGHEGHVVDNARKHADDACHHEVVAVEPFVQPQAELRKYAYHFQTGHGHEDAQEKEDGAHVNAREHIGDALLCAAVVAAVGQVAVEYLRYGPQYAEYKQDAYERRQVGDALEYGHEDEAAYAQEKYDFTLTGGQTGVGAVRALLVVVDQIAF